MENIDTIFIVQAYEQRLDNGTLIDMTQVEVYAKTEKEAIKRAKQYIKKGFYRVSQIIEKQQ